MEIFTLLEALKDMLDKSRGIPFSSKCIVNKEDILDKMLEDISIKLPGAMVESSYYTEENNLIITKGKTGVRANKEKLKDAILQSINNLEEKAYLLKIPVQEESPQEIDIETIHDEIYKQPINAYIVEEPLEVHPHVEGIDFAISLEEAKELLTLLGMPFKN